MVNFRDIKLGRKRHVRWACATLVAVGLLVSPLQGVRAAAPMLEVYRTGVRALRVAIPRFQAMGSQPVPEDLIAEVTEKLRASVARTGLLEVIDPKAYLEDPSLVGVLPEQQVYSNWSILGADALVKGTLGKEGERWLVELRLYDVGLKRYRKGKRFRGTRGQLLDMADRFADVLAEELAGAEGIAFSRFAFVSNESGTKEIYLMDIDGTKRRAITQNGSINLSPHFVRSGRALLFTSYLRRGKPGIYFYNLLTGRLVPFWTRGSLNLGGVESPDGARVALVQDDGSGNTHLLVYEKKSRRFRRLTSGYGISVSPTWSPDGRRLAFSWDRSGGPQIYTIGANGEGLRRLTFQGSYNTSPVWSPKGAEIAFVRREKGELNLYLIDTQGAHEIQLTHAQRSNEDPSWSPGGDYLVFSSNRRGNYDLYLMGAGGHYVHRLTQSPADETQPVWAPRFQGSKPHRGNR